jgi:hypothetical protein
LTLENRGFAFDFAIPIAETLERMSNAPGELLNHHSS